MMEFVTCIRDELGAIVCYCSEYSEKEIDEMLLNHPEWYRSTEALV